MGYQFNIKNGYRPKAAGVYPWPCKDLPNRTIQLFEDDVLTPDGAGNWMKHTGLGCFGIVLTSEQVEPIGKPVDLVLL